MAADVRHERWKKRAIAPLIIVHVRRSGDFSWAEATPMPVPKNDQELVMYIGLHLHAPDKRRRSYMHSTSPCLRKIAQPLHAKGAF